MNLDEVIVFSRSMNDRVHHVEEVLTLLRNSGLTLRLKNCAFFRQTVEYLGHQITPGKLGVLDATTWALRDARCPNPQTQLKSFLRMCNVYQRFARDFARIAKPSTVLTSNTLPKLLEPPLQALEEAFETLKQAPLSPPVLALPHRHGTFVFDVDACNTQVGYSLLQGEVIIGNDDSMPELHPVGYYSRTLNPAKCNYSATGKNFLGVIWAVQQLRVGEYVLVAMWAMCVKTHPDWISKDPCDCRSNPRHRRHVHFLVREFHQ